MALLRFTDESGVEQSAHVGPDRPEVTVGRIKACDLVTANATVSRRHASVTWENGAFVLRDLGSANGTYHDRQRITQVVLKDRDSVFVGSLPLSFVLEPSDLPQDARSDARPDVRPDVRSDVPPDVQSANLPPSENKAPEPVFLSRRPPEPPKPATRDMISEDSLVMDDLQRIIDANEVERGELITALEAAQERYYEASARADNAEASVIDLRASVAVLEDESRFMSQRIADLERELSERATDQEALRQERETLAVENASLRTEIDELRTGVTAGVPRELEAARQQIEDLKLANRGYLKKISRMLEEREKAASAPGGLPGGAVAALPAIAEHSERINELASQSASSLTVLGGIVEESAASSATVLAVGEIRAALRDALETADELKRHAAALRRFVKEGQAR